ncbi:hypothetical protein K501DRAFT_330549 [Backusella circina FSU 941]|nr:hypothetical protein K501DRAFT_330549 [Backusella circina FSU 941]
MTDSTILLRSLPDAFTVHQYERDFKMPSDILDLPWFTISKTAHELSLILPTCHTLAAPTKNSEDGWRALQVDAQMDFGLVGILARIVDPLRQNKIPVFVVSTYDTDYVLVKEDTLDRAIEVLNETPNISVKPGSSVL